MEVINVMSTQLIIAVIVGVILVFSGLKIFFKFKRRNNELAELKKIILKPEENISLITTPSERQPEEIEEAEKETGEEIPARITGNKQELLSGIGKWPEPDEKAEDEGENKEQ